MPLCIDAGVLVQEPGRRVTTLRDLWVGRCHRGLSDAGPRDDRLLPGAEALMDDIGKRFVHQKSDPTLSGIDEVVDDEVGRPGLVQRDGDDVGDLAGPSDHHDRAPAAAGEELDVVVVQVGREECDAIDAQREK